MALLQNESLEKNKSIQTLHNQICTFEIEIERQKEMLRSNESKIHHLQVRSWDSSPLQECFLLCRFICVVRCTDLIKTEVPNLVPLGAIVSADTVPTRRWVGPGRAFSCKTSDWPLVIWLTGQIKTNKWTLLWQWLPFCGHLQSQDGVTIPEVPTGSNRLGTPNVSVAHNSGYIPFFFVIVGSVPVQWHTSHGGRQEIIMTWFKR